MVGTGCLRYSPQGIIAQVSHAACGSLPLAGAASSSSCSSPMSKASSSASSAADAVPAAPLSEEVASHYTSLYEARSRTTFVRQAAGAHPPLPTPAGRRGGRASRAERRRLGRLFWQKFGREIVRVVRSVARSVSRPDDQVPRRT